ncbi:hypothetical protein CsSME_00014345 [Camellia sinensis var. sinensis]
MFGTAGSPSLRLADFGVTPSMADNGISSLFAMEGDQMSLEDKVIKYSITPVPFSSKLRFYPFNLRTQWRHAYILSTFTSAPTRLLTRGAALPSVSANPAKHHLIKLPNNISGNGAARPTAPLAELHHNRAQ